MDTHLYHAQCAETLDRPATATPTSWQGTAGSGWKAEGNAQGVVEARQAHPSVAVRMLDQLERSGCAHVNVGQAPRAPVRKEISASG